MVGDALSRLIEAEGHKTATQTMRKSENLVSMHVETQQTLATIRDIDDITHGTTNDHDTLHYSAMTLTSPSTNSYSKGIRRQQKH